MVQHQAPVIQKAKNQAPGNQKTRHAARNFYTGKHADRGNVLGRSDYQVRGNRLPSEPGTWK